jgi:hypothetical protein
MEGNAIWQIALLLDSEEAIMGIRQKADELGRQAGRILNLADRVEQTIQERLNQMWGTSLEPMDVYKQILRRVEDEIITLTSGERAFPFHRLNVELFVPDEKRARIFETAFVNADRLPKDITTALQKKLGAPPEPLKVAVTVSIQPPPEGVTEVFLIQFQAAAPAAAKAVEAKAGTKAVLIVLRGTAFKKRFTIERERIYIGRLPEVIGKDDRVVRRNDFYFLEDGSDVNQTVSREHAQIRLDKETGDYRISDDLSAYGTIILRDGQRHEVPRRRGLKLRSGDEIYFGEACVRFEYR